MSIDNADFVRFRDLIYEASGVHFSDSKRPILESWLRDMLRTKGIDTEGECFQVVKHDDGELRALLESITTNLARFFRDTGHMVGFREHVLPEIIEAKRAAASPKVKIWSARCSTGEEPYSLGIPRALASSLRSSAPT